MLYQLEIENFFSIRDKQVIDLRVAGNVPDEPSRFAPAWRGSSECVPKVIAIFGPNASGKSTVLRAISFVAWFVKHSFGLHPDALLPLQSFNDKDGASRPTRLSLHIGGIEDINQRSDPDAKQCRYVYELILRGGGPEVEQERLYYHPTTAKRLVKLFERDHEGNVTAGKAFDLAGYRQALNNILRPKVSVISTLVQLRHPFAEMIAEAANGVQSNILIEKAEYPDETVVQHYAQNPLVVEAFNREVGRVDFGIKALELGNNESGQPQAFFRHDGLDRPMHLFFESHGTRQFLKLYPHIHFVLNYGGIAVLDELDSALHPHMLSEIIRWFHDPRRNPHDAQLWTSCHNATLLEELTKEEILFTEKDGEGRTQIFSLRDIQGVRRTDNYYKKYLGGVYGGVPQIG